MADLGEDIPCQHCLAAYAGGEGPLGEGRRCGECGDARAWLERPEPESESGAEPEAEPAAAASGWCGCAWFTDPDGCGSEELEEAVVVHHRDNKTPWATCVRKHHWHCGVCRGLTQIG
jgi:hypothetical protein